MVIKYLQLIWNYVDAYFSSDEEAYIKKLDRRIIELVKEASILQKMLEDMTSDQEGSVSTVSNLFTEDSLKRTQSDKPSAHSSLKLTKTIEKLQSDWPEPNYRVYHVENTNSMEPFIDSNSIIIAEKIRFSVLKDQPLVVGDICIYSALINNKSLLIIHRILKVKDGKYYFLGDNNFSGDGWVEEQAIKYRYVGQVQTRQVLEGD